MIKEYLSKKSNLVLIIFILFIACYIYFSNKDRRDHLKGNVNYTIGTIKNLRHGAKTPNSFGYTFYANNELHESSYSITSKLALAHDSIQEFYIGHKYLVKYSVEKPKYNELYLDKYIPDNLDTCVKCVWIKPPI